MRGNEKELTGIRKKKKTPKLDIISVNILMCPFFVYKFLFPETLNNS